MEKQPFLFEVSWEICNKVGGIYTVIKTKLKEAKKHFGENYILIGPMGDQNRHFIEETTPFLKPFEKILREKNIPCRLGYWDREEQPSVILVSYQHRYNADDLLYRFWSDYGVDSLASNFDYIEPILFATAASEVIRTLTKHHLLEENKQVIAHFHEWLCGAGVLDIKRNTKEITTVFTTHATVLGRALAGSSTNIYNLPSNFNPTEHARKHNVFAKHSMERAAAREADCFTTVSKLTAEEAYLMLGKYPDKITTNGLDIEKNQHYFLTYDIEKNRYALRQIASKVIGKPIEEKALLWVTSGRYEFHNKGYDILLKSLAQLKNKLGDTCPTIIVFFLIASNRRSENDSLLKDHLELNENQKETLGIATHKINYPKNDPVLSMCDSLNLREQDQKIHIIYSDAYLDKTDGVFNILYDEIISSFDLSIFPSYYEPWGYTPLESIAYSTPTITTNTAGFGDWVSSLKEDYQDVVYILDYKDKDETNVIAQLCDRLHAITKLDPTLKEEIRKKTSIIAKMADWKFFYENYIDAYNQAIEFNDIYYANDENGENLFVTNIHDLEETSPRFRLFQHECELPESLIGLRALSYNLWWSWNQYAVTLFEKIHSDVWETVGHNPIRFLNNISHSLLVQQSQNESYMERYNATLDQFNAYLNRKEIPSFCNPNLINEENPIAYFSLEYGLNKNIAIYSGGLGILAGDYLKTISDLNIPMIAIGLFYKQGYFSQKLDSEGKQLSSYETANPNQLPLKQVIDESGKPLFINVELPERTLYISIWTLQVGKVSLYLLDTDIQDNNYRDRQITDKLYGGSREHRLLQEIVLGIGGTRFIYEKLNIKPSLFHLNEGHSAFLLLERIRYYYNQGVSHDEAIELVRSSSVFTTHTSVPAGNELFSEEMIRKYFINSEKLYGISIETLLDTARDTSHRSKDFSMTVLALRFSQISNAVSRIHQGVARNMWKTIWEGFLESEVPIESVTNGVHLATWLGSSLKKLFDHYLDINWLKKQDDPEILKKITSIPNHALWETHITQKENLLTSVKQRVLDEYTLRDESEQLINDTLRNLSPRALIIGFSRRFALYKRADLILYNEKRIARILSNKNRPVVLIIAGKAHPADTRGQNIIRKLLKTLRQNTFQGRLIFLENYNIALGKLLTQGVDVWLNTPILNTEACGTSGMKVGLNGGLNFSIQDGWWAEAYSHDSNIGWTIKSYDSQPDFKKRNELENRSILDILEHSIVPLFFENNKNGFNPAWVEKMKAAISHIACQFNTYRMVKDYFNNLYSPVIKHHRQLIQNNKKNLIELVQWKKDIASRFSTVKIKTILVNGVKEGKIRPDGIMEAKVLLFSGKMNVRELKVELILIKSDGEKFISTPIIIPLTLCDSRESGILTYAEKYDIDDTGFYGYGIRVYPTHSHLFHSQDINLVFWG